MRRWRPGSKPLVADTTRRRHGSAAGREGVADELATAPRSRSARPTATARARHRSWARSPSGQVNVGQIPAGSGAARACPSTTSVLARPEPHRRAVAREVDRQRRAPAARAHDGDHSRVGRRSAGGSRAQPRLGPCPQARDVRVMPADDDRAAIASAASTDGARIAEQPARRAARTTRPATSPARRSGTRPRSTTKTGSAASVAHGASASNAPSPVATPLPPRKPRKTDQQLPADGGHGRRRPPTAG